METKIWEEFHDLTNTKSLVGKKAEALSYLALRSIQQTTKTILDTMKGEGSELSLVQAQAILEETAFVHIHVIDRFAFGYLEDLRSPFMNDFLDFLRSLFINNSLETEFITLNRVNEKQKEYSQYAELSPKGDDIPAKTVFWEFGKNILTIISRPEDLSLILRIYSSTALSISLMNLVELFSGK
jgi:hypothetical protein